MDRYLHTGRGNGKEEVRSQGVSNHTEVNFWIVVDRYIDLLLRLGGASIIRGRVVSRNNLHGLFDQLVALLLEALLVAVLASVYTATKVVVLRWRRGRSFCVSIASCMEKQGGELTYRRLLGRHH